MVDFQSDIFKEWFTENAEIITNLYKLTKKCQD